MKQDDGGLIVVNISVTWERKENKTPMNCSNLMATPNFKAVGSHNPAMCQIGGESDYPVDSTDDNRSAAVTRTLITRNSLKSHYRRTIA